MNYFNKKNLVILSIVVLLIVNIATISTVIYLSYKKPPAPQDRAPRENFTQLRRKLNFTPEQRETFEKSEKNYREKAQGIFKEMHQRRIQMMDEFSKAEPDSSVLYELAEKTGGLHQELKRLTINHLLDIKNFCTEEQFRYLERRFRNRIMDDDPSYRYHQDRKRKYRNRRAQPERNER